jgi:uncharacterized membrane protein YhaH (DUF805 family)
MSLKPGYSPQTITIVVDANETLGIVSLVLSFFMPIVALPVAIVALRRSRQMGQENFWARLARNISIFVLSLAGAAMAIGLTTSVIIPSLRG